MLSGDRGWCCGPISGRVGDGLVGVHGVGVCEAMGEIDWESRCRRCGLCCHDRVFVDGEYYYPGTRCKFLALDGTCTVYSYRFMVRPDCLKLTPEVVAGLDWLPVGCGLK